MQSLIAFVIGAMALTNAVPAAVQTVKESTTPFNKVLSARAGSNWAMTTWSGTSCTGITYGWSTDGSGGCTSLGTLTLTTYVYLHFHYDRVHQDS